MFEELPLYDQTGLYQLGISLSFPNPNATKSCKILQNTPHMVWRNRPSLSLVTEGLACLNNFRGVQLGTLA